MDYEYKVGQLVEHISTGEIALFASTKTKSVISVEITDITGDNGRAWWPADDCRSAVDHAAELAAKDARIAELEALVAKVNSIENCGSVDSFLALSDDDKRKWFAMHVRQSTQLKNMRKLCGDAAEQVGCCACTCSVCEDAQHCDDAHRMHKLRAAAEGGE